MKRFVITGGGTGGHVFPALAIAEELRRRGHDVLYVGTSTGMEAKLVPEKGFAFHTIKSGAVKNQGALKIVRSLFSVAFAIVRAMGFLRAQKVDAVIGVGGYVCVPMCVAAFLTRRPMYLQEQNVSVGIANRFLGRLAKRIFLGFAQAQESFKASKCLVTGNPIRPEFYDPKSTAYRPEANHILVLGGSQGARAINELMTGLLEVLGPTFPGLTITHQTGQRDADVVTEHYKGKFAGKSDVAPFIRDMAGAYTKASLVVSRSGALTVSELIQVGRPAIFIPYPRKGQNDQTANAYLVEKAGAARVVEQGDRFKERFWAALLDVYKPEKLARMSESYSALRQPAALATIGDQVEKDLGARS